MFKKFLIVVLTIGLLAANAHAFLYDLKILTSAEIKVLTDEQLIDDYIEAKIEEQASGEFVRAAGFSSGKDYGKRKDLLRYIYNLRKEISSRPSIDLKSIDLNLEIPNNSNPL